VDHGRAHALLDRFERGRGALALVVDPNDMPAELRLERLADLAPLQPERHLLERRNHLSTLEIAKLAALVESAARASDQLWP